MASWTYRAEGETQGGPAPDLDEARLALSLLVEPGTTAELFSLFPPRYVHLPADDLGVLLADVAGHPGSVGNYVAINPLPPGFKTDPGKGARVPHFTRRRWLLLDVDPVKPAKDKNATDAEHSAARDVMSSATSFLAGKGWPEPLLLDTGGGWQALYRTDLPNDDTTRALFSRLLKALAGAFDTDAAKVDVDTAKATIHARIPGTWNRKGPKEAERPWRMVRIARKSASLEVVPLEKVVELAGEVPERPKRNVFRVSTPPSTRELAYVARALSDECAAVASCSEERNVRLNDAAIKLGHYVGAGLLAREEVERKLEEAACACGLDTDTGGIRGVRATIKSGLDAGEKEPRGVPNVVGSAPSTNGVHAPGPASEEVPEIDADDVATIDDLRKAGASVSWLWEGWIPDGVLTAIAAPGGTGKTRFCADILRRIHGGLAWPDGKEMRLPVDTLALWVVADNHHDEMVTLAETFGIEENIRINASKADPYGGVTLESPEDYRLLEARIKAVQPELVIIDTVGNATDKNLSRQEDAKAFYWPLQVLARRYRCAILCLTHLNATGQFLGRRVLEKVRVAIRMQQYEGEERRRLEIHKTNSKKPAPLGVTMGDAGNEYDTNPPEPPTLEPGAGGNPGGRPSDKLKPCMDWLAEQLQAFPVKVSVLIDRAKIAGHSIGTLYRAKEALGANEYETEGRKWWGLTSKHEVP